MPSDQRRATPGGMGQILLLAGLLLPLGLPTPVCALVTALLTGACVAAYRRHKGATGRTLWLLPAGLLVSALHAVNWTTQQLPVECWRKPVTATLEVISFPVSDQHAGVARQRLRARLLFQDHPCHPGGELPLSYFSDAPRLALGDRLQAEITLRPPTSQWAPGSVPDQARHAARGTTAMGTLRGVIQREPAGGGWSAWRQALARGIDAAVSDEAERGLLRALLVGDGNALTPEYWQLFRTLGLSHVLVISGLHVGLIAAGTWWLLGLPRRVMCVPWDRGQLWPQIVGSGLAALVYAGLAGFTVPTQRALYMIAMVLLLKLLGWRTRSWRVLLLAVNGLLLVNPQAALGSSFWMSVVATGLLLRLSDHRGASALPGVAAVLWLQCRLVVILLPLTGFWFGSGSLLAIPSNLLLAPVLTLWTIPWTLLGAVMYPLVTPWSAACWQLAAWPLPDLLAVMAWTEARVASWLVIPYSPGLAELLLIVALIALAMLSRRVAIRWGLLLLTPAITLLWVLTQKPGTQLTVLDVGQGTAVVFRHDGRTLVYDTGGGTPGRFLQADHVLVPYLQSLGVRHIDDLVISHGDLDHSAGFRRLREMFSVGQHLGFAGTPCRPGRAWHWGEDVRFQLLNGSGQALADTNAHSCVLRIDTPRGAILLAGDIPVARERALAQYWGEGLSSEVLLAAHHGSNTSSGHTWLKWVAPSTAVISRSRGNRFGHPAADVLERLLAHQTEVIDTAIDGTWRWSIAADGVRSDSMRGRWTPYWLRFW